MTTTSLKKFRLITYGCGDAYDRGKFNPIKNRAHTKPKGGLWASPMDCKRGWREWATEENFGDLSVSFETSYEGRTLVIDSEAGLINNCLWQSSHLPFGYPDYEAMIAAGVDAIYVTEQGESATRYSHPGLYGYDCECVLVMNPECINVERT